MSRINLLPWREAERKKKTQEFLAVVGFFSLIAGVLLGIVWFYHTQLIDYHKARNSYIESETVLLDKKIREIEELEKGKQRLLDRMRAIEQLQGNRPLIVRFFDELIESLPEDVSVNSIKQTGQDITIVGEAQSNARVSSFMRNLESSQWLEKPELDIIEAANSSGLRISSFTMRFKQVIPGAQDEEDEEA